MKKYKEFPETEHHIQLKNIVNSFGKEWGPDSATDCEIWYKGKHFANFENKADGGDVDINFVESPTKKEIEEFFDDVKRDIPKEYYDNVEKYYKSLGDYIWDQYKDILFEERKRKHGLPSDLLAIIDICEKKYFEENEKTKKRG